MIVKSTHSTNVIFDINVIFACEAVASVIPWMGRAGSITVPSLEPHYRRIMRVIRERIASGEYAPGDKLPSTERLREEFDVSAPTVRKAIDILAETGEVAGRQGDAVYVADKPGT